MSINSSYLNPDSSGTPYGSNNANGSSDSYGAETYGAASTSDSYGSSGGYSSYDEPASPLSSTTGASATSASATSASSAGYNSTGAYSSSDAYSAGSSYGPNSANGSSNSAKEDAVWRGQSSQEPTALKRPRVSTLVASLIMLATAAILGALAMGVHFSWTAVGASTLGTIGLVLIASAFFANRNKSHT